MFIDSVLKYLNIRFQQHLEKKKSFNSGQTAIQQERLRKGKTVGQRERERDKNSYSGRKICWCPSALPRKREQEREGGSPWDWRQLCRQRGKQADRQTNRRAERGGYCSHSSKCLVIWALFVPDLLGLLSFKLFGIQTHTHTDEHT